MRFSRLSLERYGHFKDCELIFRSGSPDLHIIYGANEAGKTTSLAAVSDLLFGFPQRSPYNFVYDYSLLRVGAALEEDGRTLVCRRKKGASGTLLNGNDATMDDSLLAGMLKGQTRETFSLSFSLDQLALRSGGKAMVEARNDLGRTLFAAGSGLTGIAAELNGLESEADSIWGATTRGTRTFTQANRQYAEAMKAVKDGALKPKAWLDAKSAADHARTSLEASRRDRDAVQAELRAMERVRRLVPLIRQREELLETLKSHEGILDLGRQREDAAEKLIEEADQAQRARATADQLRGELAERRSKVAADPTVLAAQDEVDQLVADAGAETKASRDRVGLEGEHAAVVALVARLRKEATGNADAAPQRPVAARLRELARVHGELQAAARQIAESREDIDARLARAKAKLAEQLVEDASGSFIEAVDAARALGADADARCESARRRAATAATLTISSLARLAPWTGDISDLAKLPIIDTREINDSRDALAQVSNEMHREEEQARRASDQADAVALKIAQVVRGTAVSPEEIADARAARDQRWQPLRHHVLTGVPLDAPSAAVSEFEASVAAADQKLDLRFALAEASSQLSILEQTKATHELEKSQGDRRTEEVRGRKTEISSRWTTRLAEAGLPALEPTRFQSWQGERSRAEELGRERRELEAESDRADSQRNAARSAIYNSLRVADTGGALAPVLALAERRRAGIEEAVQQRRLAQSELDQIEANAVTLDRRQQRLSPDVAANAEAWTTAVNEAGLKLDVATCGTVLDLLDELREAVASEELLRRRIDGIDRDARELASRIEQTADRIGVEAGESGTRVRTLRDRLAAARSTAVRLAALDEDDLRRERESKEAQAKLSAAEEALSPLLIEAKSAGRPEVMQAIERSRSMRLTREAIASTERRILEEGDGLRLDELVAAVTVSDPGQIAQHVSALNTRLEEFNHEADEAANAHGQARTFFAALDHDTTSAVAAAADAEQARAELCVLAEYYILKRAQAVTLKWAIERYRERHQDPLLLRAGELFSTLTIGRYATLRVDTDGPTPRLLGLRDDGRTMVEVENMSEGTTDQLFLALRLAALEQSVAAGIRLPFLADDLFVNFDDQRADAGFKVLAEVAKSTQVLFFTHHPHLIAIAKSVVGTELHSECSLQ
jgi:uncharacterized protein YhaN